jgi:hypothetical protein
MRKIILIMPVSADGFTLIIGTPAGRSPMLTFRHRPRRLWPRPTSAPEEHAKIRRSGPPTFR